jgi:hypothetical protein
MALTVVNLVNNTQVSIANEDPKVQADSVGASPSSLNDKQEIDQLGVMLLKAFLITKYFHPQIMKFK